MAKKLYIGGLSFSTTEETLTAYLSQAGQVTSVQIITDRMTGRSRGFGFAEMATDEEAAKAIEMFHGKEFEGRTLTVNEARPLGERTQGGGGRRGGYGGPRRDFGDRPRNFEDRPRREQFQA